MKSLNEYLPKSLRSLAFLLLPFSLVSMNSCSKNNYPQLSNSANFVTKTIIHEGVERTYHIQFPKNFKIANPTPMVLALHGGGGTGTNFKDVVSAGTLTTAAEERGVVLVFPEGIKKRWNSGRPEIFKGDRMYDDVGFISSIIDKMIQNYGIDSDRVYATGISNGGFMSVRLALDLSDKIAAVAPVTAQMSKAVESLKPNSPISIMIINGTEDPLVPYDGGHIRLVRFGPSRGKLLSTQKTIDKFKAFNQCINPVEIESILDEVPDDGTSVEIVRYKGCKQGTEVVLVKVIGGGHTWPRGAQYLRSKMVGVVSKEINASEMILDFFLNHERNTGSKEIVLDVKKNLILNQKIDVYGTERNYHIYVPKNPSDKPLVILLHGNRGNFNEVIGKSLVKSPQKVWLKIAKQNDFIVVVPNGSLGSKKKRGWNDCRSDAQGNPQSDDVLFIKKLLEKVKTDYDHNANKVFVAGVSNGGQFAIRLAMEIPEKITAFAAIIASIPVNSTCKDSDIPVSALFMNGTADPILPYEGGQMASNRGLVKSTEESIAYWTHRNGTSLNPIENVLNDTNNNDKSTGLKKLFKNGSNNTEVMHYKIVNGGHTEPSKSIRYRRFFKSIVGNQNGDIEMANEIWNFFKNKTK